jgi:RimJ/RimL family protein N-acetyltransferase
LRPRTVRGAIANHAGTESGCGGVRLNGMVIETERLTLRRLTVNDLDELMALHAHPEIVRFMGPPDRHNAEWLGGVDEDWREWGYGRIALTDRNTGMLLGRTGIKFLHQFRETELGWILRREAWGRGYAIEAAQACADWAFRNFEIPYLVSLIEPGNVRSIAVARRLGMTPLRDDTLFDRPMTVHSIDRDRWLTQHQVGGCMRKR